MEKILFSEDRKTLIVVEMKNGKGTVVEDSFGGYDYMPVTFSYDNGGKDEYEDDPYEDWNKGKINLTDEDGTCLSDFEEASYGAIYDSLGEEEASYFESVYNS